MKRSPSITSKLPALATLAVIVAIWLGASEGGLVPEFMLPSPAQVWDALVTDFPTLMANAAVTLQEAAYGLAIGIAVALALATLMHRVRMLYRALYPLLVVTDHPHHRHRPPAGAVDGLRHGAQARQGRRRGNSTPVHYPRRPAGQAYTLRWPRTRRPGSAACPR